MKRRALGWKWLVPGLLVLILAAAAGLPRFLGDSAQFTHRIEAELSDWTGGKVELTGPVKLRYFPDISLRGGFTLTGGTRLPLVQSIAAQEAKISLSLVDLLFGRITVDELKLTKPRIILATSTPDWQSIEPKMLAERLFADGSVRIVHLRGGTIIVPTPAGSETLTHVAADFDGSDGEGAVSSVGSFEWRKETLRFALDSGARSQVDDASTIPVTLTLTSNPINAKLTGKATLGNGIQIDGDLDGSIDDGRRFLAWLGIPLPDGESLKRLTASGAFRLRGPTLTFDDGTFSLDGNNAVGLLGVTAGARPRLEGTLAFDHLVLDPYLGGAASAGGPDGLLDWPLIKSFDADLRISAGAIDAGAVKLGHGAFTLTAKDNVVSGELSELDLCGGDASGQFGANLADVAKRITLTASLDEVTADACAQQLALATPFKGTGNVRTELAAEGRTPDELVRSLSGTLKVKARNGAVPVDLARLLTATAPLEGEGWSASSATAFDSLNADCRLAAGHVWCQTFNMQTSRATVAGSGDVDLPKQSLDWNLSVTRPANPLKASSLIESDAPKLSIRGSLSQPMIRRADRPTLGEGNPQARQIVVPVSPH